MNNEDFLECPYDKHHRILKSRMQTHLGKCRLQHLNVPKETCPFNVTHIMNKPELEFHVTVCPERALFEKFSNVEKNIVLPKTAQPPMPVYQSEENWDNDDAQTYNPSEYVANANIIRNIRGAPPSERKKFRQQERLRLLRID